MFWKKEDETAVPPPVGDEPEFVKWFSELSKDSVSLVGGKGANLAEIYNLGVPVPPGFSITAQAYNYFIENAGLKTQIEELLDGIDYENTKQLDGLTERIRRLIVDAKFPKMMEEDILEAYNNLSTPNFESAKGSALDILKNAAEPIFVAVRSSATVEDSAEASFAGQQDTYLNVKGNAELLINIKKCFASLFTSRATYYRNSKGFDHSKVSLSVVVQKMVDSDKSGVIFSKDPSYNNEHIIIEAVFGLGEGIVSGTITPDTYIISRDLEIISKKISDKKIAMTRNSNGGKETVKLKEETSKRQVLKDGEIRRLAEYALKLEEHYNKPQDIEFAIERDEIYIVQTRPITTMEKRIEQKSSDTLRGKILLEGLAASPGIASGKVKIVESMEDLDKVNKGDILVTRMTNPDMVVTMQKSAAIVTDEGGLTAHAAIVSREMGIPCVVGTQTATEILADGDIITVDGFAGKVYKDKISEKVEKEIQKVSAKTKTEIKIMVDLPTFAERSSRTGLKKVGLVRIEGIIAESGKHPEYFLKDKKIQDYEGIIFKGISGIAKYFEEIWVRTSDIRTDEFSHLQGAPKEIETNPMLGMHGIRYGLENPKILKAELRALKGVSDGGKKVGVMMPQIISVDELKKVKEILNEIDFTDAKVGIMVETPAAIQLIRNFCEEGIDFISFGTNDLTQYILAVDRGNEKVQKLYDEMHPAVLYQLEYAIRVCKRNNVETSICGQAGSKKEMVKYLVEKGIDSISVNADAAKEISEYVYELENEMVKGTDEEPREYHAKKKEDDSLIPEFSADDFSKKIYSKKEKVQETVLPEIRGAEQLLKKIENDVKSIEEDRKKHLEDLKECKKSLDVENKKENVSNENSDDKSETNLFEEKSDEEPEFDASNIPTA